MDCIDAHKLIERGLKPGSHPPLRARLGFHIAACSACRNLYEQTEQARQHQPRPPAADSPPAQALPPPQPPERPSLVAPQTPPRLSSWQLFQVMSLVVLVALPLIALSWVADSALDTYENLQAMVVTPLPERSGSLASVAPGGEALPPDTTTPPGLITGAALDEPPAHALLAAARPTPTPPPPTPEPPAAGKAVTILLLGSDQRPDQRDEPHTDSMMLVRVDPAQERIALLSLPRDLWVPIPGYWPSRINDAYRFGERSAPGHGLSVARDTVSHLLNISIDYVAFIDFQGFMGLIDAIGGITVDVPTELYDAAFPTMDYGYTVAHFMPGLQHMDGMTALMYSRIRHPDSDFERIRRQQAVLSGIGARLRERGDLRNLLAVEHITEGLAGYVRTDMPAERIVGLIWAFRQHEPISVEHYSINRDMVNMGLGNDRYALLPIIEDFDTMTDEFLHQN
jgi:LCP family protein required for cell wall assembly